MRSYSSLLVAFLAVNLLAATVAFGLSGGVVFMSWLVPDEAHELGGNAPALAD